jgi:transposase
MEERIDIPDPSTIDAVEDLGSARALLKQLLMMLTTLQTLIQTLQQTIDEQRQEIEELKRSLFGQKRERVVMPPVGKQRKQARSEEEKQAAQKQAQKTRRENAEKRRIRLPEEVIEHRLKAEQLPCGCPSESLVFLSPKESEELEYVPAHFIRRTHRLEVARCGCGEFHQAPAPQRVSEGVLYGPGLHAHAVVAKCADSLPLNRVAKGFGRAGVPIGRSTLTDLYHRTADLLEPVAHRLVELAALQELVHADETSVPVQEEDKCRRAYIWTFVARHEAGAIVAYRFSADRSGETPVAVLGATTGYLQVDGYTGYNAVTTPKKRRRIGCWTHARRKYFEALPTSPEPAKKAIEWIRQLYEVEYAAAEANVLGTPEHLALRTTKSAKILEEFYAWVEEESRRTRPKSPLGKALKYMINQRKHLERFLEDPRIPLDNNISERALRGVALGRKNFLFVGHDKAGARFAVLQTLVSTCIANKVNPQDYIADVLLRIQTHPHSKLDELLPFHWKPPPD